MHLGQGGMERSMGPRGMVGKRLNECHIWVCAISWVGGDYKQGKKNLKKI